MTLKSYILALQAALFTILLAVSPAGSGSMTLLGVGKIAAATGCADSNVVAWEAAVVSAGGTVSVAQDTRVCTLVGSLKTHSLFNIQDRIWLHASENTQQATIDIVNLGVATPHGTIPLTSNQGYTGDGSTGFLDSGYTSGTNFLQNSASISSYVLTSRTAPVSTATLGRFDGPTTGNQGTIGPLSNPGTMTYDVNNVNFASQVANVNAQGFWTSSRTGASVIALYKNSNSTAFGSGTATSNSLPTGVNFFIGASNNSGTASGFSTDQIAITTMGGGMTNTQVAQFQTDLNNYMKALPGSPNVY